MTAKEKNSGRADRAEVALTAYAEACKDGTGDDPLGDQFLQLAADFLHLQRREACGSIAGPRSRLSLSDWLGKARLAWVNYEAECDEAQQRP